MRTFQLGDFEFGLWNTNTDMMMRQVQAYAVSWDVRLPVQVVAPNGTVLATV